MALTREIIETSSEHIDEVAKLLVISLIRQLENYRLYANIFSAKLVPAIENVEGTLKARQINAILREIDKLGIGEVEIQDKDGVRWSQSKERQSLVFQLFTTLFDDSFLIGSGDRSNTVQVSKGNYGIAAIKQRPCYCKSLCKCNGK